MNFIFYSIKLKLLINLKKINFLFDRIIILRDHLKNLSLYLLASIITSFMGIMINPFLAINLSPKDYAIIGYFTSFNTLILPILSFSLLSYYSRNYYRISEEDRQSVLDTLIVIQIIIGLIGLLFVLTGFYVYMNVAKVNFPFFPFAVLCFIPTFFSCFYNFLLVEKRMRRQAISYFKIVIVNAIIGVAFMVLFVVVLKYGAIGRFWAALIPPVGIGIYSIFKLLSKFQVKKQVFIDALTFGWPISLSAILYYFLSGIDRAMLEKLNDTNTFGYYNVAIQISTYFYIFYSAILQTFEPDIYKSIAENNRKKLLKICIGIIVLNAFPTLLFIIFAHPVVKILTFGRYMDSVTFSQILALKNIALGICFLVSDIIIGFGYPNIELINRVIGAGLSVILFYLLISKFGFYGAAWGQSISVVLMTLISGLFIIYKLYNSKCKSKLI
jgi:O-antigen/teichoic acid export membrane protein